MGKALQIKHYLCLNRIVCNGQSRIEARYNDPFTLGHKIGHKAAARFIPQKDK